MVKHLASGLWVHGTYGVNEVDDVNQPNDIVGWYLKAGWSNKFNSLGATHFYGEYGKNDDAFDAGTTFIGLGTITASDATRYGVGIVQEIDAAAMSMWVKYRHHELDATVGGAAVTFDDVDMFLAGAVIFY